MSTPLRRLARLLPAALIVAAACSDAGTGPVAAESPAGLLLVVRGAGAEAELWSMRPDGSEARRLTHNRTAEGAADWSPDGSRIVYASFSDSAPGDDSPSADLWVMRADGSGARRLFDAPSTAYNPRWSPDGRQIAFEQFERELGHSRVYVMDADGANVRLVTTAAGSSFAPEWSPDGTRLLYVGAREARFFWTLYVATAGDWTERQLSGDAACPSNVMEARWSPDGARIAYTCDIDLTEALYTMRADGSGAARTGTIAWGPVWSPDGLTLAFNRDLAGGTRVFARELAAGDAGADAPLVPTGEPSFIVAWSRPAARR